MDSFGRKKEKKKSLALGLYMGMEDGGLRTK